MSAPGSVDERNWLAFIDSVREQAGESIELKALIHGEAGSEETYLAHLRRGRVQLSTASFAASTAIVPEVAVLSLPYLFDSVEHLDFVVDEYLDAEFTRLFADKGLVLLRWLDVGWVNVYGMDEIRIPEDAVGKRLRSPASPAGQLFIRSSGADVVVLPFADVLMSLDTGLIDGGITTSLMYNSALAEKAPFLTLTRHSYEVGFLLANGGWYEGLSPSHRRIVTTSFPDTDAVRADTREYMRGVIETLTGAGQARRLDCDEMRLWITIAGNEGRHEDFVRAMGPGAERLYRRIMEAKRAYRGPQNPFQACP